MKCLCGIEYKLPESLREWDAEDFEDFSDVCKSGKCIVYVKGGEVKFIDREMIDSHMYYLANEILSKQIGEIDEKDN